MDEPKKAVFFSLITKGTPEQPRWMISDQWDRVWNDPAAEFVEDHKKGTLFASFAEAASGLHSLLIDDYKNLPTHEYEVPVRIKVYSNKPIDAQVVAEWCHKACRMLLDAHGSGYGPLDGTLGVVVADWLSLKAKKERRRGGRS